MEIYIIPLAAFLAAILTFFSGFGLGTILTPVFAVFFPVELAIALTGVVHFSNNVFKLFLVGRNADKSVLLRFGIPAVIAAFAGAYLLLQISDLAPLFSYSIGDKQFQVTPVKFVISLLLILFALIDVLPVFRKLEFGKEKLPIGGLLSGFFGGLSGNQGALRSAFLIKSGLSKESFIATGVIIACFVDFTRISIYASRFLSTGLTEHISLVLAATLSAFAGAYIGNKVLKKITLKTIQLLVTVLIILLSLALGSGII